MVWYVKWHIWSSKERVNATWLNKQTKNNFRFYCFIGSTAYLLKLCGGLLCGWISDPIGRKKAMILINIPVLVSWYYFYYAKTITELFVANGLLGFASGFLKIPCVTYVGEVSQPSVRGILVSSSTVSTTIAPLLIFLLATMTTWRNIALYACALQFLTLAALFLVSEFGPVFFSVGLVRFKTDLTSFLTHFFIRLTLQRHTSRSQNHQFGFWRKTVRLKHSNHWNGFVGGKPLKVYEPNLNRCNDTKNFQTHVRLAVKRISNVRIHHRALLKISRNWSEWKQWSRLWSFRFVDFSHIRVVRII